MINVMIAEDDVNIASTYVQFLTEDKDIKVVSLTTDGDRALKEYLEKKPDILILDLDMPKKNGLEIIEHLSKIPEERNKCNIIVITGDRLKKGRINKTQKVYAILEKPVKYEKLAEFVKQVPLPKDKDFEKKKKDMFISLNLKPSLNATKCLSEAVDVTYNDPTLEDDLNRLYTIVSVRKKISIGAAKWRIINSIKRINKVAPQGFLKKYFYVYNKDEEVTPKNFFSYARDYLKNVA